MFLLLPACGAPPSELLPAPPGGGPFASSQVKPRPAASSRALDPLPRSSQRLARQEAYFDDLAQGKRPSKAKLLGPQQEPLAAGKRDLRAGALPHLVLQLSRGRTVLLETRRLTAGGDTVLHLWSPAKGRQLAFDDDGGSAPGSSALRYTAAETESVVVLVRAYSGEDDGRCDLLVDGQPRLTGVKFGGSAVAVAGKRTLHAVLLNDRQGAEPWPPSARAARDTLLLLLDPATGALRDLDDDSGVELGSRLSTTAPAVALVGAFDAHNEGSARLVVNDAGAGGGDRDGLGDGLEQALCLCASATATACGFACKEADSPQDSDGDGLSDAEELLGIHHAAFPQLLARWGADPRHKDLFVEIDLAQWTDNTRRPPVKHFGRPPSTAEAHAAAAVFARLTSMGNPDGKPGIRLHLDLGHACGAGASGVDQVCGALCSHGADGVRRCGQNQYVKAQVSRRYNLAPGRLRRFHLAVADCLVAGSAPVLADTLEYDCDRHTAMVHELGHNLGLARHYGTLQTGGGNCKPNYPSLMNYAYSDRFAGGRQVQFSDGSLVGKGDLDPRDLDETRPLGGSTTDVSWLATRPFFYDLYDCASPGRGCKVDFNRDGKLDPSVQAYLSPMPNYGWICENIHGNALDSENIGEQLVSSGPAAAEMLRKTTEGTAPALHVFVPVNLDAQGAALLMSYTTKRFAGWSAWRTLPGIKLGVGTQPAAATLGLGSGQRIHLVVSVGGNAPLRHAVHDGSKVSAFKPVPGQPAGLRARDVTLVPRGTDLLLLVRDDAPGGGDLVYLTLRKPGGWSGKFSRIQAEQMPLRSTVTPAAAVGPDGRLYVATGDPDPPVGTGPVGRLHLYSHAGGDLPLSLQDEELRGLRFADGIPDHEHVPWSRPAMAFVPHLDGKGNALSGGRGYLALWWNRDTRTRFLWSWGRLDQQGASFRLGRWHHYEAFGYTDAITGTGPALVLRQGGRLAALISQSNRFPSRVRHIPHADGIPDTAVTFRDHDDRPTLRKGLCRSLNWDCPERCKDLTLTCGKADSNGTSPGTTRCALPSWDADD